MSSSAKPQLAPEMNTTDIEESFVSALGWAMQEQGAGGKRLDYSLYISEALAVADEEIFNTSMQEIFRVVRAVYMAEGPAFCWALVHWRLVKDGKADGPLPVLVRVVLNEKATCSSLPVLAREIQAAAQARSKLAARAR